MADFNKYLDILYGNTKDIGREIGSTVSKVTPNAKKIAKSILPYVDAAWYTGQGIKDFQTGHPWRGAGQLGLAGLDAALDTASLLTGGTGLVAKQAGKQVAKKGVQKILQEMAKRNTLGSTLGRGAVSVGLQYGIDKKPSKDIQQLQQQNLPVSNSTPKGNTNNIGYNNQQYPSTSTDEFVRQLVNMNGIGVDSNINTLPVTGENSNTNGLPLEQQGEQAATNNDMLNKLLDYYNQQKEYRKPYLEALQDYVNNYGDYQRRAFNMDRYLAGIAGWSGNNNFANMMGKYDPSKIEATRLDLLNKLAQEQVNELDLGNKAIGNASLLEEAGLSPNAAFADPAMIKNVASIMNARTAAEARRYAADQLYKARVYDTQLDNAIKRELGLRRNENAKYLTQLREQNRYNIAQLQAQAYGYGNMSGIVQGLPVQ